jgi:hypothetical protein
MTTISYCGGSEFIHQKPAQSILPETYANARVNSPLQSVIGHNKAAPHRNSTQPMHHGDMGYHTHSYVLVEPYAISIRFLVLRVQ